MSTEPLKPIPTPPSQIWKEFCVRVVPIMVFVIALFGVTVVWRDYVAAPAFIGEAEPVRAQVTSPQPGMLAHLNVTRFQLVTNGEPLAVLVPSDGRLPLSMIQAEIDLLRTKMAPEADRNNAATSYERLRLEWLIQKVELAKNKVELARAESDLKRNTQLFQEKLISEDLYDLSLKTHEALLAEVGERSALVTDIEKSINEIKQGGVSPETPATNPVMAAIELQENALRKIEQQTQPITLLAPIDGMVSFVFRQVGENVIGGEPIITISSTTADRVVGYLRQPFPFDPQPGQPVEIHTRSTQRIVAQAQVTRVGAQFEAITNSLAMIRSGSLVDMGLPVEIALPPEIKVRPGEVVDLVLRQK